MSEQLFRLLSVQAGDEAVIIHVAVGGPCERLSLLFTLQVCIFYFFVPTFVLFVFFLLSSGRHYLEAFLSLKKKSYNLALVFFKVTMEISRFLCE
jgi:hypothetical protein